MITIKAKLENPIDISDIQRQWNNVVHFALKRLQEGKTVTDTTHIIKATMKNINLLDATWIESAVQKAKQTLKAARDKGNTKIIYGSRYNFTQRKYNKITEEEFQDNKKKKLQPIMIIGKRNEISGNRKFKLDVIENNQIILKFDRNTHFNLKLKISKKQKKTLCDLQLKADMDLVPLTISLNSDYVFVSYDECILKEHRSAKKIVKNRIMGLDLNPNYIGVTVMDCYGQGANDNRIIHKEVITNKAINGLWQKGTASDDPLKKYITNKRNFETFETAKHISAIAKHYGVEIVGVEKPDIESKDHSKGKTFNRMINNNWNREKLCENLKKRCNLFDIKCIKVVPAYSSFIGQMTHENEPDMIAAALEIGRRAYLFYNNYVKETNFNTKSESGKKELNREKVAIVFPVFNALKPPTRWKEMVLRDGIKTWIELYQLTKKPILSYRFLWDEYLKKYKVPSLRLKSYKSNVLRYIL